MIDIFNLQPNKVSTNLNQYTMMMTGDSGVGKTTEMFNFLTSIAPEGKVPLFLEFEDRFANIPGIVAIKINTMQELKKVFNQLRIPKAKDIYSCVVIDTIDKFEEFCKQYEVDKTGVQILKDVGPYGEGEERYKSHLPAVIGNIQRLGFIVHGISQTNTKKDFDTKIKSEETKLKTSTFNYFREAAYMIGYMWKDEKTGDRYVTFKRTINYPHLKDCFNLPDKIKTTELKEVWEKAIEDMGEANITNDVTIDKEVKQEHTFDEVMEQLKTFGSLLFDNGYGEDAMIILKKNLGADADGNVISYDTLTEAQIEAAKVIELELEELVDKYNLK